MYCIFVPDNNNTKTHIMAYVKISDRNLQMIKVSFLSKDVNVTRMVREDRIERFRQDVLWANKLQGTQYPHMIKQSF